MERPGCVENIAAQRKSRSLSGFQSPQECPPKRLEDLPLKKGFRHLCVSIYALFLYTTNPAIRSAPITPTNNHNISIKCSFRLIKTANSPQSAQATTVRELKQKSRL